MESNENLLGIINALYKKGKIAPGGAIFLATCSGLRDINILVGTIRGVEICPYRFAEAQTHKDKL